MIYNTTSNEVSNENDIKIIHYNNYIKVLHLSSKSTDYSIYNITGKLMGISRVSKDNNLIPLGNLIPGIYILKLNNNGNSVNYKFIK